MPGTDLGIDLDSIANGLVVGTGGTTSPNWANNVRTIFQSIIDDIEAKINSAEIAIDANLEFNNFRATEVSGIQFQDLTTQPVEGADIGLLYEFKGDLYYNDSSNNAIRMTIDGAINIGSTGQITGMSGSAAVTYSGVNNEYVFVDDSGFPSGMDHGPIQLKEQATGVSNAVTLTSPASLGGSYSWTYPTALPGSGTELVTVTSAGQMDTTSAPTVTSITSTGIAHLNAGAQFRSSGFGNQTLDTFEDIGTYTPVLKVSNVTKTPDTIQGSYCRIGSWVMVHIRIVSDTENFGTGRYTVTLPYDANVTFNLTAWTGAVSQCSIGGTDFDSAVCLIDAQATDDPDGNVSILADAGESINATMASGGAAATVIKLSISYLTDAAAN